VGARGPIGQSDNVRFLRGNPGHRRGRKSVRARPGAPAAPTWLSTEAKAEWRRVVPELDELGILARVDRAVLAAYCDAWAKFTMAARQLDREGLLRVDRWDREGKHPLWSVWRDASGLVAQLAKSIGASPEARLRMALPERPDDDDDAAGILD
jgi:P27 family predicted phage terminase small subunit